MHYNSGKNRNVTIKKKKKKYTTDGISCAAAPRLAQVITIHWHGRQRNDRAEDVRSWNIRARLAHTHTHTQQVGHNTEHNFFILLLCYVDRTSSGFAIHGDRLIIITIAANEFPIAHYRGPFTVERPPKNTNRSIVGIVVGRGEDHVLCLRCNHDDLEW